MRADFPTEALERAWGPARAAGVVGSASVEEIREHTAGFLSAVCALFGRNDAVRALDIGSGAGIPGLLLAWELPSSVWTLLDSSQRRCDFAADAVLSLDLEDRVTVVHGRADERVPGLPRRSMDVVTARLLGNPAETVELCAPYCRAGGLVVVSIAARDMERWTRAGEIRGVDDVHFSHEDEQHFVSLRIGDALDSLLPRRPKARARRPLFEL